MIIRRFYVITEGVHDVAFLGKIFKEHFAFSHVKSKADLDSMWQSWIDTFSWPHQRGKIDQRAVPVPSFYKKNFDTHETFVALANATGIDSILNILDRDLEAFKLNVTPLDAIGIVLDSDKDLPQSQFQSLLNKMENHKRENIRNLSRPVQLGVFSQDSQHQTRCGIFVFPNNQDSGTLETILINVGANVYPDLKSCAENFINQKANFIPKLLKDELTDFQKPAGEKKATIASMCAILKPAKPVQTTIEDHRWVSTATLAMPEMKPILDFLQDLIGQT